MQALLIRGTALEQQAKLEQALDAFEAAQLLDTKNQTINKLI